MSLPALVFRLLKGGCNATHEIDRLCQIAVMDPEFKTIKVSGFRTMLTLRLPRTP